MPYKIQIFQTHDMLNLDMLAWRLLDAKLVNNVSFDIMPLLHREKWYLFIIDRICISLSFVYNMICKRVNDDVRTK